MIPRILSFIISPYFLVWLAAAIMLAHPSHGQNKAVTQQVVKVDAGCTQTIVKTTKPAATLGYGGTTQMGTQSTNKKAVTQQVVKVPCKPVKNPRPPKWQTKPVNNGNSVTTQTTIINSTPSGNQVIINQTTVPQVVVAPKVETPAPAPAPTPPPAPAAAPAPAAQ